MMSPSHTFHLSHVRCALLLAAMFEPSVCAGLGKAAAAKWMAEKITWGTLSTISSRGPAATQGTSVGVPFGNPYSFADTSNGTLYFYATDMDASMIDIESGHSDVSFALSEASLSASNSTKPVKACTIGTPLGDPENPPCARLVFTGQFSKVTAGSTEEASARKALFAKHPSFANYPPGHDFFVGKMELTGIWLIDFYGGASIISPADYLRRSNE